MSQLNPHDAPKGFFADLEVQKGRCIGCALEQEPLHRLCVGNKAECTGDTREDRTGCIFRLDPAYAHTSADELLSMNGCSEDQPATVTKESFSPIIAVAPFQSHGADKYDAGKPPLELLDQFYLVQTAKVLGFGAEKYAPWNWTKGIEYSRLIGAALRHIHAFNGGEDNDPESGLPHIAHASCCLMFLLGMTQRHPELDNRPTPANLEK